MRLLAAACLALMLAGPARGAPALFVVRGGGAPLYLFGSIHVLRAGLAWRTPKLRHVLDEAKEYWFETTDQPSPAMLLQLVAGLDLFHPLHTLIEPKDYALLTQKLGALRSGSMVLIDHMRPWLAAIVVLAADVRVGQASAQLPGVDVQLMAEAGDKPVHGLETLNDLINMMNAMPKAEQLALLRSALHSRPETGGIGPLQDAWAAGNLQQINVQTSGLQATSPELFGALLRTRNARWINEIDELLHRDKPVLVTVGAAHLVGPDGLPSLLRRQGYQIERIQ